MKILYLLFSFTTGGTERLVADICNEMVQREHQVHLYIVNDHYDRSMLDSLVPEVRVKLQNRAVGGRDKVKTLLALSRYIRENGIEVIHCNSFGAPELLILKPLFFSKTRIVHTIHDVGQYQKLGKNKRILRNWLCHRFVAISDCVKKDIISHGADAKKVVTIYNAIDLKRFAPRPPRPEDGRIRIGNVARIMPEKKGQDVLIRAVAQLCRKYPNLECVFAGEADEAHGQALAQLKALCCQLEIQDRVTFLGNVADVPGFLQTLDIFVLPSRYEGFGISLIEAMAMEIPCAASALDGPAEILDAGRYGTLFPCGEPEELANKLDVMLTDLCRSRVRAKEAAGMVRSRFDIRTMCRELETQYN